MFSLIEHIEYLVAHHDCVVVPDWGAFIANYLPARYVQERGLMESPRRTIGFNPSITHNDGLLAQSLMRREGMTYEQAVRYIADSVTTYRQQLAKDCEVEMGWLGIFRNNDSRLMEFVPSDRENAIDRYFGLADLKLDTVESLEREHAAEPDGGVVVKERGLFSRKATRIAASIAALIGLGIMFSTPIIVDRSQQQMASIAPTVTTPHVQQVEATVQQDAVDQTIAPVQEEPVFHGVGNTSGKFYMVIATLRNQHELDAFKLKYASLVPYMKTLIYKGLTCVYVARSDDYGQLMSLRSELPERLRDVWIYN